MISVNFLLKNLCFLRKKYRSTNHIENLWRQIKLLSGYYTGIPGNVAQIQRHIDFSLWRRRMRHSSEVEIAGELCHIIRSIIPLL